jgi:hypothetical protein
VHLLALAQPTSGPTQPISTGPVVARSKPIGAQPTAETGGATAGQAAAILACLPRMRGLAPAPYKAGVAARPPALLRLPLFRAARNCHPPEPAAMSAPPPAIYPSPSVQGKRLHRDPLRLLLLTRAPRPPGRRRRQRSVAARELLSLSLPCSKSRGRRRPVLRITP